jgi:hypothetical protein
MVGGTNSCGLSARGVGGYTYTLDVNYQTREQNTTNNQTRIDAWANLNGQWIGWNSGTVEMWLYWCDDTSGAVAEIAYASFGSGGYNNGGMRTIANSNFWVTHQSDGTCKGHVWCKLRTSANNAYLPNDKDLDTASYTLDTIPRASSYTLSSSKVELGQTVTFTISPHSTSFSHRLYYTFNGTKTTIADVAAGTTTYTWTVPTSLATQITTSSEQMILTTVDTLSGDTIIGTGWNNDLTLVVPSSYTPTLSNVSYADATSGDVVSKFGGFIQNKSKLIFTLTASGYQGSSVISYSVNIDGYTYSSASNVITTNVITTSGSVPFTASVTDSRGRVTSTSGVITIAEYFSPKITSYKAARATKNSSTGVLTENETEGTYAYLSYAYSVAPINNKNTVSFVIQYRKLGMDGTTGQAWTSVYSTTSGYSASATYEKAGDILSDMSDTYEVRFGIKDYFSSDYQWNIVTIGPSYTLMNFGKSGKSIALFGQSSDGTDELEVNGTTNMKGNAYLLVNSVKQSLNSIVTRFISLESWKQTIASWKTNVENGNTDIAISPNSTVVSVGSENIKVYLKKVDDFVMCYIDFVGSVGSYTWTNVIPEAYRPIAACTVNTMPTVSTSVYNTPTIWKVSPDGSLTHYTESTASIERNASMCWKVSS